MTAPDNTEMIGATNAGPARAQAFGLGPSELAISRVRRHLNVMTWVAIVGLVASIGTAGWTVIWHNQQVQNSIDLAERGVPATGTVDRVRRPSRSAPKTEITYTYGGATYSTELPGRPPSNPHVQLLVDPADPQNVRFLDRPAVDRNWLVFLFLSIMTAAWSVKVIYGVRDGLTALEAQRWEIARADIQAHWGRWISVHISSESSPNGRRVTALARAAIMSWTSTRARRTGWVSASNRTVLFISDGPTKRFLAGRLR